MSSDFSNLGKLYEDFTKPIRRVVKVFIHCSAASRANIDAKEIHSWHLQRGWAGIGYHYFIKTDGTIECGRDVKVIPAAQEGHNDRSIAICVNGLNLTDFTASQFNSLRKLCNDINTAYNGRITFHGHCEVSAKACPVFDYRKILGLDSKGKLGAVTIPIAVPVPSTTPDTATRMMKDLIEYGFTTAAAAGIVGNMIIETGNFKYHQELKPLSGRGGIGYIQWTGPRRTYFEKYARDNNLVITSYEANYGYLIKEMEGYNGNMWTRGYTLAGLKVLTDPAKAAKYFCDGYERPGIPHIDRRVKEAVKIFQKFSPSAPAKFSTTKKAVAAAAVSSAAAIGTAAAPNIDTVSILVLLSIVVIAGYFIYAYKTR